MIDKRFEYSVETRNVESARIHSDAGADGRLEARIAHAPLHGFSSEPHNVGRIRSRYEGRFSAFTVYIFYGTTAMRTFKSDSFALNTFEMQSSSSSSNSFLSERFISYPDRIAPTNAASVASITSGEK